MCNPLIDAPDLPYVHIKDDLTMNNWTLLILFLEIRLSNLYCVFFSEKIMGGSNGSIADDSYNLYKV